MMKRSLAVLLALLLSLNAAAVLAADTDSGEDGEVVYLGTIDDVTDAPEINGDAEEESRPEDKKEPEPEEEGESEAEDEPKEEDTPEKKDRSMPTAVADTTSVELTSSEYCVGKFASGYAWGTDEDGNAVFGDYANAFDGDTTTYYRSDDYGNEISVAIELETDIYAKLDKIEIYPAVGEDEDFSYRMSDLMIQGSTDSNNWITLYRFPSNREYTEQWYTVEAKELLSAADYSFTQFRVANYIEPLTVGEVKLYGTISEDATDAFPTEPAEPIYSYMTVEQYIEWAGEGETFDDWYFGSDSDEVGITYVDEATEVNDQIIIMDGVGFNNTKLDLSDEIDGHSVFAVYSNALFGKSITSVTMDDSSTCKYILNNAFISCGDLTSVTVSKALYRVDDWAFQYCPITGFEGPAREDFTEEELEDRGYNYVFVEDGVLFRNEDLVCYPRAKSHVDTYTVPDYVSTIGNGAFILADIDTIRMNGNVLWVNYGAFRNSSVKNVYLSPNLRYLGGWAFQNCKDLVYVECLSDKLEVDMYGEGESDYEPYMFYGTDPENVRSEENDPIIVCGYEMGTLHRCVIHTRTLWTDPESEICYMDHVVFQAYENETITWYIAQYDVCAEDEVFIIGVSAPLDATIDTLPTEINGMKVVGLNRESDIWSGLTNDDRVGKETGIFVVPEGVRYLWGRPFSGCENLKELVLPSTLEEVDALHDNVPNLEKFVVAEDNPYFFTEDDGATLYRKDGSSFYICSFAGGSGLTHINVKDGAAFVEYSAFQHTPIETVTLPGSVREIGSWAFEGSSLKKITLPKNVNVLGDRAFASCPNLEAVTVERIGDFCAEEYDWTDYPNVFEGSEKYTVYVFENTDAHRAAMEYGWNYVAQNNALTIYETYTADDGVHLSAVLPASSEFTIPEDVMVIDDGVFKGKDVDKVTFPNTLHTIGAEAFADCGVFDVEFAGAVELHWDASSFDFSFFDEACNEKHYSVVTEPAVDGITYLLTAHNEELREAMVIGYSESAILDGVLNIPEEVTYVGDTYTVVAIASGALDPSNNDNAPSPTSIVLPDTIRYIGDGAMAWHGDELKSVKLPKQVRYIANDFVYGCTGIESYTGLDRFEDETGENPFRLISVADDVYAVMNVWNEKILWAYPQGNEAPEITIPSGVEAIGWCAFLDTQYLKTVNIEEGLRNIYGGSFDSSQALETVTVPASVLFIDSSAFRGCNSLTKIDISKNNDRYEWREDDGTVRDDDGKILHILALGTIPEDGIYEISDDVEAIANQAAQGSSKLKVLIIPENVKEIGDWSFSVSYALEKVFIKGQVDFMNMDVFAYCENLEYIKYYGNAIDIWQYEWDEFTVAEEARKFDLILVNMEDDGSISFKLHDGEEFYSGSYTPSDNPYFNCTFGDVPVKFGGTTMTLANSLSVDFVFDITDLGISPNGDSGYYAKIVKSYADGRGSVTVTVPQSEWKQYSGYLWYASFDGVAAKEMCDDITITLFNEDDEAVSETRIDSIREYAMRMLAMESVTANEKLRRVYVDMLNYGAEAQNQFSYNTDDLANKKLTDTHKSYATESVSPTDHRVNGIGYAGTTLTLESRICLDFVFNDSVLGDAIDSLYAIATYTDHYGKSHTVRIEGEDFGTISDKYHYVSVNTMAVADCYQIVECVVYDAEGDQIASASDSVEGYVARNLSKLNNMVTAIMKFGDSAYKYFDR